MSCVSSRQWRQLGFTLLCLGFLSGIGCNKLETKQEESSADRNVAPATRGDSGKFNPSSPKRNADVTLNAEQLSKEFLADSEGANAKYQGKVVELEGTVDTSNPLICGLARFYLNGATETKDRRGFEILCKAAPDQESRVPWLGKGQKIRINGRVEPYSGTGIRIRDCEITELDLPHTLKVMSEQMTKDFTQNPDAVEKKYGDQEIIVEGVVAELSQTDGPFRGVKLSGSTADLFVSCILREGEFNQLKKGQKVRIKGTGCQSTGKEVTVKNAFLLQDK